LSYIYIQISIIRTVSSIIHAYKIFTKYWQYGKLLIVYWLTALFSRKTIATKLIFLQTLQILRFREKHLSRLRFSWSLLSQCGNEDKSFLVKEKALGVEGSWSNQWSR